MRMAMVKFVKVLRIEMEDLEAYLECLVAKNYRRQEEHEETQRVCRGNVATLRNEGLGVQHFVEILDGVDVDNFDNLDHLVATIRQRFHDVISRHGLAEAAIAYADRKIAKVEGYVADSA